MASETRSKNAVQDGSKFRGRDPVTLWVRVDRNTTRIIDVPQQLLRKARELVREIDGTANKP